MKHLEARAALLRVKECDLRMDCLLQCDTSIDRGLHVGGAFSSLTAMTALYYSGLAAFNVTCPTDTEQDLFVLSKGHAVAALAAVYADLGYISRSDLYHSRGYGAAVKGHPGPVLPGVPVATGPLGHGISICCGYAMRRMELGRGNVYCMVGDGELQEGSCWEGAALAADRGLRNLCVLVDQNNGQSDDTKKLVLASGCSTPIPTKWNPCCLRSRRLPLSRPTGPRRSSAIPERVMAASLPSRDCTRHP